MNERTVLVSFLKFYNAISQCEDGVIFSKTDIITWMVFRFRVGGQ